MDVEAAEVPAPLADTLWKDDDEVDDVVVVVAVVLPVVLAAMLPAFFVRLAIFNCARVSVLG